MPDKGFIEESGFCPECLASHRGLQPLFFRTDVTTNGKVIEECRQCDYSKVVGEDHG